MERGRKVISPFDNKTDSYFTAVVSSSDAESATPGQLPAPSPIPLLNSPDAPFRITISESAEPDNPNSGERPPDAHGINLEQPFPRTRRPSIGDFFTRKQSFASVVSFGRNVSPSPSTMVTRPQSPSPSILPRVSANNIWDEIDDFSALSIDYFRSTMTRFADARRPEPQSCLDFSLLHTVNIRHLEHLLYAELKWVNEAMDRAHIPEGEYKIDESPEVMKDMERKYPARLKSIQNLLDQYATAVRNFEDMRKRPVKASYEFTFEKADESTHQKRPSDFFSSRRRRSGSKTSPSVESTPSLKPTLTSESPRRVSDFGRAATVMRAVNKFGRPIGLAQRRAARQIRLSHRSIAGVEDWERDFKLQNMSQKTLREETHRKQTEAFWRSVRRLVMAVVGGIALIIPVIIMTLNPGVVQSLVTTSVATFLFAIFVVWYSDANEKDIVAGTAAYAAVLVVFVGTSLQTPQSTNSTGRS